MQIHANILYGFFYRDDKFNSFFGYYDMDSKTMVGIKETPKKLHSFSSKIVIDEKCENVLV